MRQEIETLLRKVEATENRREHYSLPQSEFKKRLDARAEALNELMTNVETDDELRAVMARIEALHEAERVEREAFKPELEMLRFMRERMTPWVDQERAKGRPESELTWRNCKRETGLVSQEQIEAQERWRKGPHCPEDQVYLDAMDECGGRATMKDLTAAMVKRMGAEFGADEASKIAAAKRILERWTI